jgi:hypothetical protein
MSADARRAGSKRKRQDDSVAKALERARAHARLALSEGVCAARALLDAAALSVGGEPPEAFSSLGRVARTLDELSASLAGDGLQLGLPAFDALLTALDSEISRWESRSQSDSDARAVLRAFLGLREILWEFGMRRSDGEGTDAFGPPSGDEARTGPGADRHRSSQGQSRRIERRSAAGDSERRKSAIPRVQHVKIQG